MKLRFGCLMLCLLVLHPRVIAAQLQGLPMSEQSLENMDGFCPVAGNWCIAGHVTADRHTPAQISTSAGDGILVNVPDEPGQYTYVCTFPGHAFTMRGMMRVVSR